MNGINGTGFYTMLITVFCTMIFGRIYIFLSKLSLSKTDIKCVKNLILK